MTASAGYNLLEGAAALAAGAVASSTALLGFGLDSFIEVSSALVVIWQFRSRAPEARERVALRLIAVSFLALAAWITVDAVRAVLLAGLVLNALLGWSWGMYPRPTWPATSGP